MSLPYNTELEQALLASLFYNNNNLEEIEFLREEHFYYKPHSRLFSVIKTFYYKDMIANPITLAHYFKNNGEDFQNYILSIAECIPSLSYTKKYAEEIYDLYLKRELLVIIDSASQDIKNFTNYDTANKCIESLDNKIYSLLQNQETFKEFEYFSTAVARTIENMKLNDRKHGISSGFIDIDKLLGGLHPSDLIILAGRPSMGKTALGTNIAYNVARNNHTVLFFSLEMSTEQLVCRILSQEASIPSDNVRKGIISNSDMARFIDVAKEIDKIPLLIDDNANTDIDTLCNRAKKIYRRHKLELIVVDYVQLVRSGRQENRVQEVSEITRKLKGLAKSTNTPVIALSQLSRAVETRDDKRPQLSDLRESGSIEQDADAVGFIYREDYYLARKGLKNPEVENQAEIIFAKHRHGPIGIVRLHYDSKYTKFSNFISKEDHFEF